MNTVLFVNATIGFSENLFLVNIYPQAVPTFLWVYFFLSSTELALTFNPIRQQDDLLLLHRVKL